LRLLVLAPLLACAACTDVVEVLTPPPVAGNAPGDAGSDAAPPRDAGISGVTVDGGQEHTCATRDGALYCFGSGSRGKLGLGDTSDRTRPARVGVDADWIWAAAATQHSCALRSDGTVHCFGANDVGQLGVPGLQESLVPLQVALPAPAQHVIAEHNHTCALLEGGRLSCWGENTEGQLGLGDTYPADNYFEPVEVARDTAAGPVSSCTAVDTGQGNVCSLRAPGELHCWGRNSANQWNVAGAPLQIRAPVRVGTASDWISVQAGQDSSCVINASDELYCSGNNSFANLGTGDRVSRETLTLIAPGTSFRSVSIDTFHGCALTTSDALYCWGRAIEGQLGLGDLIDRESPALVPGGPWKQVAVGRFFTCAVDQADELFCTGADDSGQLGLGDTNRRNVLELVTF